MLLTLSDHVNIADHESYLKHLTLFRNVYYLVREYHRNKMSKYDSEMQMPIKTGMFCLLRLFPDSTKAFYKLRPCYHNTLYRIVRVFNKSLLVARLNDISFQTKFMGHGRVTRKQCRRIGIEDVKI